MIGLFHGNEVSITVGDTKDGISDRGNALINGMGGAVYSRMEDIIDDVSGGNIAYKVTSGAYSDYNGDFTQVMNNQYTTIGLDSFLNNLKDMRLYTDGSTYSYTIRTSNLATKPTYRQEGSTKSETNSVTAYILSASQDWLPTTYNRSNYGGTQTGTIDDIQDALWRHGTEIFGEKYNEGRTYTEKEASANGNRIYEEAVAYKYFYENYIKSYGNNVNISLVNPNNKNVIVNKNKQTITVGPYIATYPDDGRFSFIENMYVTLKDGNTTQTIDSINVINANNNRTYPGSGEPFFIEFNYNNVNITNNTKVILGADFAYIKEATAQYNRLVGAGDIVYWEGSLSAQPYTKKKDNNISSGGLGSIITQPDDLVMSYNWEVKLVQNSSYNAQVAAELITAKREWTKIRKSVEADSQVELFMQIGGRVFVDVAGTKESTVDGYYNSQNDTPMSNVTVHLYSRNSGTEIASTKTDGYGKYEFKGLNVLDQYYLKFDYNGQYYEPTHYWDRPNNNGNYQNTSNGTDYVTDRNTLNVRFSSIGSSPSNYSGIAGYNQTYSKKDLLGYTLNAEGKYVKTNTAVIDEFGNLVLQSSTNPELQKKIQFVKDCQMSSWTKSNGANTYDASDDVMDLYPFAPVLVITNRYDKIQNTLQYSSSVNTSYSQVLSDYNYIQNVTIASSIEDKSQHINQGYKLRQEADISLKQDVYSATIEINGKSQTYEYNSREASTGNDEAWEIGVRISDGYYGTLYSRELYSADYQFKVSDYGTEFNSKYGKTKDDELKVYVTYRLYVKNQSMSIRTKIDEIVHYYDSEYEYVSDSNKSYIEIGNGTNAGTKYSVKSSNTSRYAANTMTNIGGYQKMYITGLDGIYLDAGQYANIYLTFIVEKSTTNGQEWIKLDENAQTASPTGVGKESISEINGYSTVYKTGTDIPNVGSTSANTVAGLVDIDSNPGNLSPSDVPKDGTIKYQNFEDDTDKAPNIRLVLYRGENNARITSGYVWEDERTLVNDSQATATGNGIRENGEKLINGVTVEFVEIMNNGTEYIWRTYENGSGTAKKTSPIINVAGIVKDHEFTGDTTGTYAFKSYVPGNYIVRFKYGDTVKTVLAQNSDATKLLINEYGLSNELKALLNDTSYNGQDYKSTIYQTGLGTYNGKNTTKQYNYDIAKGDTVLASDAKDLYDIRENIIAYSNGTVNNAFAELLASYENVPVYNGSSYSKDLMKSYLNEFIAKTAMVAETGIISMQVEYNTTMTSNNANNNTTSYHLANLDLGLEQRPKAQIEINKAVKNLKVTLANGNVLFDANGTADNLLWQPNLIYGTYTNNLMDPNKFANLTAIRTQRTFGLVQPTMDQELMHGATVRIEYEITAKNIGETDYKEQQFYYTGIVNNKNTLVTTNAIQVVDYIPNNIQYYEIDNKSYWSIIKPDELVSQGLVNSNLKSSLEEFNTIVTTKKTDTALVPSIYTQKVDSSRTDSVSVPLVLTQLITTENKTKDLTYNNKVELVLQSNTIGRKMAYSVPGNQDPTGEIVELDADLAKVSILPPFGAVLTYTIIALITISGAAIIVLGIIFIKKKVLTK